MIICNDMNVPKCLAKHLKVDTHDEEQAHDRAARSFAPHKLTLSKPSRDFHFVHSHAFLNDIALFYTSYGTDLIIDPEAMDDFYLVQIPVQGSLSVEHGSQTELSIPGKATIISPGNHTRLGWGKDCGLITVKITRSAVENQLGKLIQSEIDEPVVFNLTMNLSESKKRNWYIESLRLMQHFQYDGQINDAILESNFENRYIEALLDCQRNNYSEKLCNERSVAPSKVIGEAIDYLHENLSEKISLAEVASIANVSARTLHNGFKRYCNQSPLEYLNTIRLRRARQELKRATDHQSVTSIAHSAGFSHLGRFSQQYFSKYAEKPSETFKHARA